MDLASGKQTVFAQISVPVDPSRMEVKQVWYRSKDGTRVPMFLVYRKGLSLDGNNPVYLTGYGGFNVNSTPFFSALAVVWSEYGGVFALPALRGGGEFGEDWHRAVMFEKKQNTFDDFLAAAEWLIANKYTNSSRLAIEGGSNGGLLVGAFMNQRPELCRAVVCTYPLLDMLRYHLSFMGPFWVSEYGSADSASQFPYLHAYSPYHNFKKGTPYPAVMFVTGDSDTRVNPMHARKMTALMQADPALKNPVLLYYDTKSGHAVAPPASKRIDDMSFECGFLFWQLSVGTDAPGKK
jgi:prolyl oligopeptidase